VNPDTHRQQLLFLWTGDSSLDSSVVAWSFHDGNDLAADLAEVPYRRGVDALGDGWRLLQASSLATRPAGDERQHGVLEFEWLFERVVPREG
jgi:hypothetical protein